jgi:YHS domain-containing protein
MVRAGAREPEGAHPMMIVRWTAALLAVAAAAPAMAKPQAKPAKAEKAVCPVMRRPVDAKSAAVRTYKGQTVYLCCTTCERLFDRNPDKYVKAEKNKGK